MQKVKDSNNFTHLHSFKTACLKRTQVFLSWHGYDDGFDKSHILPNAASSPAHFQNCSCISMGQKAHVPMESIVKVNRYRPVQSLISFYKNKHQNSSIVYRASGARVPINHVGLHVCRFYEITWMVCVVESAAKLKVCLRVPWLLTY